LYIILIDWKKNVTYEYYLQIFTYEFKSVDILPIDLNINIHVWILILLIIWM